MPTQPLLEVNHVTIRGSASNGVALHDGAGFAPGSAELTIEGSAQSPVGMWARAVDGVPTGRYTGNARDGIMLYGQGQGEGIFENATVHERGVPYLVGHAAAAGTLYVGGNTGLATLTIEPGVTMGASSSGSASCPLPGMPPPNSDAAIRIFGVPASQFVTNTKISASAGHGIDRGYVSDVKQDFLATNTFSNIALCKQTYPGGVSIACPAPVDVPCPK